MTEPVTQPLRNRTWSGPPRPEVCHRTRPDQRMQPCLLDLLPRPGACRPAEHSDPSGLRLGSNQRLDRGKASLEGRMKTGVKNESRFENEASRYAAYLETPEGRLRADLAFANLQEFLPASAGVNSLRALDLGCGTGAAAVRLARLGTHVTLLDSSATMLALAERTIVEAGVSDKITVK